MTEPSLKRELGLRDLTLFAVTCVVSARWIPLAAHAGPGSVTLWLLAALFFAAPLTVAVAALVAKNPKTGGLYVWTRQDFGPWHGFFCAWVYWIGIAVLFPTAAMLFARVGFSLLGPGQAELGDSRVHLMAATVAMIWVALGANMIGLKVGKWAENIGALATVTIGGGLAGGGSPRIGDSDSCRARLELGHGQFLGGDRLRHFRHGRPRHDGRRGSRPRADDAPGGLDRDRRGRDGVRGGNDRVLGGASARPDQ